MQLIYALRILEIIFGIGYILYRTWSEISFMLLTLKDNISSATDYPLF